MQKLSTYVAQHITEAQLHEYRINCASKATSLDVIDVLKDKLSITAQSDSKYMIEFKSEKSKSSIEDMLGNILNKVKLTAY